MVYAFFDNKLASCCFFPVDQINGQFPPILFKNYKGQILSKEDLFSRIHNILIFLKMVDAHMNARIAIILKKKIGKMKTISII